MHAGAARFAYASPDESGGGGATKGTAGAPAPATSDDARAKAALKEARTLMDQGDLVILSCLQQNRPKITPACDKVLKDHGQ